MILALRFRNLVWDRERNISLPTKYFAPAYIICAPEYFFVLSASEIMLELTTMILGTIRLDLPTQGSLDREPNIRL